MKKSFFLILVFSFFIFTACNENSNDDKSNSDSTKTENNNDVSGNTTGNKYQVKSGVVTYKTEILGMEQKVVLTFDDFGAKEVTDTYMEIMGISDQSRSMIIDGYSYTLNLKEKTGTKIKVPANANTANIDFTNLTEEMSKEMSIKKEGKETFLGKECDVFSMDYKKIDTKGKYWVWKGVSIKSDMTAMGMNILMEAVSIDENAKIDQTIFEIPKDFTITEN